MALTFRSPTRSPLLGDQVRNQQHRPLVITARTLRDFLEIGLRLLVLAEQPIDGTEPHRAFDRLAGSATSPLVEQCIERGRAPAVAILAARRTPTDRLMQCDALP